MRLGLSDLLAPQFLVGLYQLNDSIHKVVSFLGVDRLQTSWDDASVVYSGDAKLDGTGDASPAPLIYTPSERTFQPEDVNVGFRLTVPRRGAQFIRDGVATVADTADEDSPLQELEALLDSLEIPGDQPSEYPGVAFRLELLFTAVTFHLADKGEETEFYPARIGADGWLERDNSFDDVRFTLPKVAMVITQGDDYGDLRLDFTAWGINSLDDPTDLSAGELVSMTPPLCIHKSGIIGFGLEKAVLDLTADFTPPEVMEQFAVGDEFRGLWLPHVRIFLAPWGHTGLAFDVRSNDLLIDFESQVSGEFALDVLNRGAALAVEPLLFEGDRLEGSRRAQVTRGHKKVDINNPRIVQIRGSRASVIADGELQLSITGGQPQYEVSVKLDGVQLQRQTHNGDNDRPYWSLGQTSAAAATLEIVVTDSSPPRLTWEETIELQFLEAETQPFALTFPPLLEDFGGDAGFSVEVAASQPNPDAVILQASPSDLPITARLESDGTPLTVSNGQIQVPTPGGLEAEVQVVWELPVDGTAHEAFVLFPYGEPATDAKIDEQKRRIIDEQGGALTDFLRRSNGEPITLAGHASYQGRDELFEYNQRLSKRRAEALRRALNQLAADEDLDITLDPDNIGQGTQWANGLLQDPICGSFPAPSPPGTPDAQYDNSCYQRAVASFDFDANDPIEASRRIRVERSTGVQVPVHVPTTRGPTPMLPDRPPVFRRMGLRVRLERNELVLAEVSGELDFHTQAEQTVGLIQSANAAVPGGNVTTPFHPGDGVVDYRLTASYDTATQRRILDLQLGSGDADQNGLLHMNATNPVWLGDVLASLLTFAPLLADSTADAIDSLVTRDGDSAVRSIAAAAQLSLAAGLGLSGAFELVRITLYGGQLRALQSNATAIDDGEISFDELAVLFDYGVRLNLNINLGPSFQIVSTRPLDVRYRALGVEANFDDGLDFAPVFDTSQGFELDLADPGLFNISGPLGDILKVLGARVARVNPLMFELDLGMKVNLGVIKVDRFRVTLPVDPVGPPTVSPTGVGVDIPGALTGSGYLDLRNGVKGSLDLTVVPLKIRLMAGLGVEPLVALPRKLTAVIVTMGVEFPTAVPLAATGLGLFGVLGLFAMHYKRTEDPTAQIPALDWLNNQANGNPTHLPAWMADPDRWAFGVGAVLGTLEGGTLLNLKGMLMLELPGPRILVFVKAQVLKELPATEGNVDDLGVLAVVDLNFALRKLTIGMVVGYEIQDLIRIRLPVEAGFGLDNLADWRLYLGRITSPASADVLGLVRAQGYLMFDGIDIPGFPTLNGNTTLQGLAAALGIRAAVVLGDESSGLYLKVAAAMDVGLSFAPFHLYGLMELRGKLHLFIVSIAAWARLGVEAPDPTYITGEACGEVKLVLMRLKGCVRIRIGQQPALAPPPKLLRGMVLQSRSPALIQGQGVDRPIDASLGEAEPVEPGQEPSGDLVSVPIDAVPILKLSTAPLFSDQLEPFTQPLVQAPRLFPDGWVRQGNGREIRYILESLDIEPPLPQPSSLGRPPATWRAPRDEAAGADNAVDLALFSWTPDPTPRAVQRSAQLTEQVRQRWGHACHAVAPAAPVLWTFNPQQLGPSTSGWNLQGAVFPDPPETRRSIAPDPNLHVHAGLPNEPLPGALIDALQSETGESSLEPATVIGDALFRDDLELDTGRLPGRVLQLPFLHPSAGSNLELPPESDYPQHFDSQPQRILIESGTCASVRLLLALQEGVDAHTVLRALDAGGGEVAATTILGLNPIPVNTIHQLPSHWRQPSHGSQGIDDVFEYLSQRHPTLTRLLVDWTPPSEPDDATRLELAVQAPTALGEGPAVLVGAIELVRQEEENRKEHDDQAREAMIETIESSFQADALRPLLARDTLYRIKLGYRAEARQRREDGSYDTVSESYQEELAFRTDAAPPERLEPWVMATTPHADDGYHFVEDAVEVYFNDDSAIQLFEAYRKSLKVVLRKANGDHPDEEPPLSLDDLEALEPSVLPPFDETLAELVDQELECVEAVERSGHRRFTLPIPLERGTRYSLDIESLDSETDDPPTEPAETPSRVFRTAFTTSRFLGAAELGEVVRVGYSRHRLLRAPLPALAETPSDAQIEQALMEAGLEAVPPSAQPGVTFLWSASDELAAVLIDSPEPLWRSRPEPVRETVASDNGDMEHWVLKPQPYLEVVETSSGAVDRFVRSPGGTRTLVMLNAGAAELRLALRQRTHSLSPDTPDTSDHPLLEVAVPAEPLWRLNHV